MLQGTGSNVGKSLLVAGLCRYFHHQGIKVIPFKPQNMSNNAAVCDDADMGFLGEIGRAQAMQAMAAHIKSSVHMNPILLKPQGNGQSQIIVQGQYYKTCHAAEYYQHKEYLLEKIMESYYKLAGEADLMLIEGAGSPAETNLRQHDVANMGFCEIADCPVIMVGDIDRGGVIASLAGTHQVLSEQDRRRIKAFIINRFRGNMGLFADGMDRITHHTGWQGLGIIPWFDDAHLLPSEDSQDFKGKYQKSQANDGALVHIIVPKLHHIANFDDLDPLAQHPNIRLSVVEAGKPLPIHETNPANCMILLTGSKHTIKDCRHLYQQGWDIDIKAHIRQGGRVLGLCGGYQMLGKAIHDPDGIEDAPSSLPGLGLLDMETTLFSPKITRHTHAKAQPDNHEVSGYEIHNGRSHGPDCTRPMLLWDDAQDGAISHNQQVMGCYMHGLFHNASYLNGLIAKLSQNHAISHDGQDYHMRIHDVLDQFSSHLANHLDMDALLKISMN